MHVSEFPHKNENTLLFVLLLASVISGDWMIRMNKSVDDICVLIKRLSTKEGICKLRNLLDSDTTSEDVTDFSIRPNFELEKNLSIRELLRALDAEELLMLDVIDLDSFFVKNKESVHLGYAVHRTHVKVTEEDTIAGSVTVVYTGQERCSSAKQVVVNHDYPFV
ncbi:antithrombin-iii-like protein [Lasius niger]|uniref:Antithrombin-iii-like protein n=1 Tax=Lasius niger TaxID=67767 RepID=A0A0J7JXY3_LASNI|nr:antithrombin-iii-like protein [Lasius niger]